MGVSTVSLARIVAKWTNVLGLHDFAMRVGVALASALADERRFVEATGTFWRDGFSNRTVALAHFWGSHAVGTVALSTSSSIDSRGTCIPISVPQCKTARVVTRGRLL